MLLEQLVENFGFFQKLLRKHPPLCNKLLRQIRIKLLKRGQTLFFAGDLPDNFYIILKGGVFILIPKDLDAMKLERNEETDRIKHFLLRLRTEKALSPFMKSKTTAIKRISISLLRSKSLYNDSKESFKGNMSHYYKKEVTMDFELKDFEKPWLYFEEGVFKYNCINVLNAGQSFGELGLLIKKPRNATILCKEDTQFLYLEKNDYMLLEQINRHKILKKLAFFSQFFFKNIVTNDYILKMIYNFQKKKFGYGQSLFKEEEEIDGCYIIKRGRVVVKKVALKLKDNSINPKENKLLEGNESILENKIRKKEKINNGIEVLYYFLPIFLKNYLN